MLTTTVDGLWALQVLAGVEVVAPELGLRPYLPSAENTSTALAHPVAEELRFVGAIDGRGMVDPTIREWLTVLSRREVALLIYAQTTATATAERILMARFSKWWVSLERCGPAVRLSGTGTASSGPAALALVSDEIKRLCGTAPSAPLRPVSIDSEALLRDVRDGARLTEVLARQRLDTDQTALLEAATDPARSGQISFVAMQSSPGERRSHIESGAVTVIDTPAGRLVCEHLRRDGRNWMVVSPGSPSQIAKALGAMLRRLPAHDEWSSYRKVV